MVSDPMFCVGCSSKTGFQADPPFSDFQTPPDAAPTNIIFGFSVTTSIAVMRPLIFAGPTLRIFKFFNLVKSIFCAVILEIQKIVRKILMRIFMLR